MRLTFIKLSGFQSFAEPTNFLLPGQLVGVVRINGCGKSTVMQACDGDLRHTFRLLRLSCPWL